MTKKIVSEINSTLKQNIPNISEDQKLKMYKFVVKAKVVKKLIKKITKNDIIIDFVFCFKSNKKPSKGAKSIKG